MSEEHVNTVPETEVTAPAPCTLGSIKVTENAERGVWMPILDPGTLEETDMQLLVHGEDSSRLRKERRRIASLVQSNIRKRGKAGEVDIDKTRIDVVVAAVSDWRTKVGDGYRPYLYATPDAPLECTKENRALVFSSKYWLLKQIEDFIEETANFS